jgi:hypothetical protein
MKFNAKQGFINANSYRLSTMKNAKLHLVCAAIAALLNFYSVAALAVQSDFVALPQYSTIDALGVNVFGNTVAPSVDTLAIGGALGLSHSITLQGNLFTFDHGNHGYRDKFAGSVRYTDIGKNKQLKVNGATYQQLWVMTASAMNDSAQFVEMCNGLFTDDPANTCTAVQKSTQSYYEAVKDKRHTLVRNGDSLVWTKPDGTEVYFFGSYYKIIYPNGFTIDATSAYSVKTNTGFQLKYDFVPDNRSLDATKSGIAFAGYPSQALSDSTLWWTKNPKYIRAINNAFEYCDQQAPCTFLTKPWPTVTFEWPGGMPRAFYLGKSVFSVTNPAGATAEFNYESQDANADEFGIVPSQLPAKTNMAPRLVSIKPFGALKPTISFTYKNAFRYASTSTSTSSYTDPSDPGILTNAAGIIGTSSYSSGRLQYDRGTSYLGYRTRVDMIDVYPTILELARFDDGDRTLVFDTFHMENLITDEKFLSSSSKKYTYINNNVQLVTDQATGTHEAGGYPPSCINPTADRNRKTCNKPGWVKDSKGNTTSFTYHDLSGQVESVTLPPNSKGISAVIRTKYGQKFANYIQQQNATKTISPTGIWLKVSEKTCINSATVGDTCAGGSADEVVTNYEYNNDNLLLTAMTVTAANTAGCIGTKRTTYEYDIYGNRIGETQPKAYPNSCN